MRLMKYYQMKLKEKNIIWLNNQNKNKITNNQIKNNNINNNIITRINKILTISSNNNHPIQILNMVNKWEKNMKSFIEIKWKNNLNNKWNNKRIKGLF